MAEVVLKTRQRSDYNYFMKYQTRWNDNDMYDHLNNSVYYFLFDSVVNKYLINHCFLKPPSSSHIGLVVHSHCDYFSPVGFPATLDVGLRVNKLGKSSVTYEIGVFDESAPEVKAVGSFIHVFVERVSRRPSVEGIPTDMRGALGQIAIPEKKL